MEADPINAYPCTKDCCMSILRNGHVAMSNLGGKGPMYGDKSHTLEDGGRCGAVALA